MARAPIVGLVTISLQLCQDGFFAATSRWCSALGNGRWANNGSTLPHLGQVHTVDTLELYRELQWWQYQKQVYESYTLSDNKQL